MHKTLYITTPSRRLVNGESIVNDMCERVGGVGMVVDGIFEKTMDPSRAGFDDVGVEAAAGISVDGLQKSGTRLRKLSMTEVTSGRRLSTQQRRWSRP